MAEEIVVRYEKKNHIAIFSLDRPAAMNAVNAAVSKQLEAHLEDFEADDDMWVGIIESLHPTVFCAGADLKDVNKNNKIMTPKGGFAGLCSFPRTKPLIAAIDGKAFAGGMEIALACDMVVASPAAQFGVPEVKRSLIPAAGGLFRLPRKIPNHIAMEIVLTGDPISAQRGYELGFVNVLCAASGRESLMAEAIRLAERITVNAPLAVREAKACIDDMISRGNEAADLERSMAGMKKLARTPDYWEGPKAFIEKRKPNWTGKPGPVKRESKL